MSWESPGVVALESDLALVRNPSFVRAVRTALAADPDKELEPGRPIGTHFLFQTDFLLTCWVITPRALVLVEQRTDNTVQQSIVFPLHTVLRTVLLVENNIVTFQIEIGGDRQTLRIEPQGTATDQPYDVTGFLAPASYVLVGVTEHDIRRLYRFAQVLRRLSLF